MGTDVLYSLKGTANFNPWMREHCCTIEDESLNTLTDISLRFWASPTNAPHIPSSAFIGVEDLRLYVNEHNVTPDVIAELQRLITPVPVAQLSAAYLLGTQRYLAFIRAYGTHNAQVAGDDAAAAAYAASGNWPSKLATLGQRVIGWSGNLHIVNYIYKNIALRPVSLEAVWASYVRRTGAALPTSLKSLPRLRLLFSQGNPPSLGPIDTNFIPGGALNYQLDVKHVNPLASTLNNILQRLTALHLAIDSVRMNYLQPMDNQLSTIRTDVTTHNTAVTTQLNQLTNTVNNIAGP